MTLKAREHMELAAPRPAAAPLPANGASKGASRLRALIESLVEGSHTAGLLVDETLEVVGTNLAARNLFPSNRGSALEDFTGCNSCPRGPSCGSCLFVPAIRETVDKGTAHRGLVVPLPRPPGLVAGERLVSLWSQRLHVQGVPLVLAWCRSVEHSPADVATERIHLRELVDQLPDGVVVLDSLGISLYANDAACRLLSRERASMIGERLELASLTEPETTLEIRSGEGPPRYAEVRLLSAHWDCRPALLAVMRDVTARERAREQRDLSEGRFRALFENITSGVVTCRRERGGADFVVLEANRAARRLEKLEHASVEGIPLRDLLPEFGAPELRALIEIVASNEGYETFGPRWVESSRVPGWRRYRIYALPGGEISIVYEDLSAQKRTELAFHEAQRLDAIGKLAGGVAHEFNNTLQTIMAAVEISRLRAEGSASADLMNRIEGRVRQGTALVQELLLVGRKVVPRRDHIDLGPAVRASCQLLRRVVRENVAIVWSIDEDPLPVHCDPRQIDQILVNLVNNSVDALQDGGRIIVEARACDDWAEITVSDDGPGIPAALRDRVFEPFFTGKQGREGAGLGLAVVRGIVEQNEGLVEVEGAPGGGACFRVRLPLDGEHRDTSGSADPEPQAVRIVHGRGKRLLLVEDEEGPREMLKEMLELLGYDVDSAVSAEDALERMAAGSWDLVLTDFMLPGLDGRELVRRIREEHPGVGVVMMSGYARDEKIVADVESGALRFVQKPFELSVLASELELALSAGREIPTPAGAEA